MPKLKKLPAITKQISAVAENALSIQVNSQQNLAVATETLSVLNKFKDRITQEKEKITKPLNDVLKAERARWKPMEDEIGDAISVLRNRISIYQTRQVEEQKAQIKEIADKTGKTQSLNDSITALESVKQPVSQVKTQSGMVKFKTSISINYTNLSLIPDEYYILDERKILEDAKKGITIPGVEVKEIQVPVNYRA